MARTTAACLLALCALHAVEPAEAINWKNVGKGIAKGWDNTRKWAKQHIVEPIENTINGPTTSDPSRVCNGLVRSKGYNLDPRAAQGQLMDASTCGSESILELQVTPSRVIGSVGIEPALQILGPALANVNIKRELAVDVPAVGSVAVTVAATGVQVGLAPTGDALQVSATVCISTTSPVSVSQCAHTQLRMAAAITNGVLAARLLDVNAAECFADGTCATNFGDGAADWVGGFSGFAASVVRRAMATIKPHIMAAIVNTINANLKDADLAQELAKTALPEGVTVKWNSMAASLQGGRLHIAADVAVATVHQGITLGAHGARVCIGADGRWRLGAQATTPTVEALADRTIRTEVNQVDFKKLHVDIENGGIAIAARVGYSKWRAHPKLGVTLRVNNGHPIVELVCSEFTHEGVDLGEKLLNDAANVALHFFIPEVQRAITNDVIPKVQQAMQRLSLPKALGSLDPSTLQLQLSKSVVVVEGGGVLNVAELVQRLTDKVQAWKP